MIFAAQMCMAVETHSEGRMEKQETETDTESGNGHGKSLVVGKKVRRAKSTVYGTFT